MIKNSYILMLVWLMYACCHPDKNDDHENDTHQEVLRIELSEPRYLDIIPVVMDMGTVLKELPNDIIYIGPLKQQVIDSSRLDYKDEYYAEIHDSICSVESIKSLIDTGRINHLYILADSSVSFSAIDRLYDHDFEIVVHLIHINRNLEIVESCLHKDNFDSYDLVLRMINWNLENYAVRDSICLYEGAIYQNCDSIQDEILKRTKEVGQKNQCLDCAFRTYKLKLDSIVYQAEYWSEQLCSTHHNEEDSIFLLNQFRRWQHFQEFYKSIGVTNMYVPYYHNILLIRDQEEKLFSRHYKFANDCFRDISIALEQYFEVNANEIPIELYSPEIYYNGWRIVNARIIKEYDFGLRDAWRPLPPPPEPIDY